MTATEYKATLPNKETVTLVQTDNGFALDCINIPADKVALEAQGWTLERIIRVPTKPYAVIAPNASENAGWTSIILTPDKEQNLVWRDPTTGSELTEHQVYTTLESGTHRVVFEGEE